LAKAIGAERWEIPISAREKSPQDAN
jgi:hypothetical protein